MIGDPKIYDYLLLCDGSTINAELYPELVAVLDKNTLPNLIDGKFLEGAGSVGEYKEAGLPNIEGEVTHKAYDSNGKIHESRCWDKKKTIGAFFSEDANSIYAHDLNGTGLLADDLCINLKFSASKSNSIYGSSTTVQPKSMTVKYYICYAG